MTCFIALSALLFIGAGAIVALILLAAMRAGKIRNEP